jgi:2-(1,2-epoxy-1,2-dihydrophenyl)acetyl-CoA isomerase
MDTAFKTLLFSVEHGIATISLNRPDNLNAIDLAMLDELLRAIFACTQDHAVRVIVVRGEGRAFSSGGDIKVMEQMLEQDAYTFMRDWIQRVHLLEMQLRTIPKPVIASVHGIASGQGMNLALACDLRIAGESATFNESFVRLGLTSEGTYFLPRLVGVGKATELFFTGDSLSSSEALQLGLVNRVVPDLQLAAETKKWAARMAEGPTEALGRTKLLINRGFKNQMDQHLNEEAALIAETARTEEFRKAVKAFVEKRGS